MVSHHEHHATGESRTRPPENTSSTIFGEYAVSNFRSGLSWVLDRDYADFREPSPRVNKGEKKNAANHQRAWLVLLSDLSTKSKSNIRNNNGTTKAEAKKDPGPMGVAAGYVAVCRSLLCD